MGRQFQESNAVPVFDFRVIPVGSEEFGTVYPRGLEEKLNAAGADGFAVMAVVHGGGESAAVILQRIRGVDIVPPSNVVGVALTKPR